MTHPKMFKPFNASALKHLIFRIEINLLHAEKIDGKKCTKCTKMSFSLFAERWKKKMSAFGRRESVSVQKNTMKQRKKNEIVGTRSYEKYGEMNSFNSNAGTNNQIIE